MVSLIGLGGDVGLALGLTWKPLDSLVGLWGDTLAGKLRVLVHCDKPRTIFVKGTNVTRAIEMTRVRCRYHSRVSRRRETILPLYRVSTTSSDTRESPSLLLAFPSFAEKLTDFSESRFQIKPDSRDTATLSGDTDDKWQLTCRHTYACWRAPRRSASNNSCRAIFERRSTRKRPRKTELTDGLTHKL